jgi:hypothetical protein
MSSRAARGARRTHAGRDALELFVLAPDADSDAASLVASFRNARVLAPFPRRGGEAGARWQRIIRAHEATLAFLEGRAAAMPDAKELRTLGRDLFETLLPGDVRRLYDSARSLQPDGILDLVLTSMIDWVADKPWELAFDPSRREFLATSCANIVRNVFTAVPAERPARRRSGRLRVLVVSSRPRGVPPLAVREETARIRAAFRELVAAGLARIEALPRATPERLQRRLAAGRVDVLHFIGHGAFDAESREGSVLMEDASGRPRPLAFESFRQIVCRRGLRLVFLNACETGRGGRSDWNRGVAPALVAAGLPAVVANQYSVLDAAATAFAADFYAQLARGKPLADAAREARLAVGREQGTSGIDWAVPVLFARDPRETLR